MAGQALATVATVFDDVLSLVGVPTGTATQLLQSVLRRRMEAARDIFLDEMRHGEKTMDADEVEEAVTVVHHYLRAAQEGSARANLRVVARVIDGQARRGRISADEFLPYASILATLREAEVVLLGGPPASTLVVRDVRWGLARDQRPRGRKAQGPPPSSARGGLCALVPQDVAFNGEEAKQPKRRVEAVQRFARSRPPKRQSGQPRVQHSPGRLPRSVRA